MRIYLILVLLTSAATLRAHPGAKIYADQCARCHGPTGEGVADKHDEPLYGDRSIESLSKLITRTMPEDTKQKLSPDDSAKVPPISTTPSTPPPPAPASPRPASSSRA